MSDYYKPEAVIYAEEIDSIDRDAAAQVKKFSRVEKEKLMYLAKKIHMGDPTALDALDDWEALDEISQAHYIYLALMMRHGVWYQVDKRFIF